MEVGPMRWSPGLVALGFVTAAAYAGCTDRPGQGSGGHGAGGSGGVSASSSSSTSTATSSASSSSSGTCFPDCPCGSTARGCCYVPCPICEEYTECYWCISCSDPWNLELTGHCWAEADQYAAHQDADAHWDCLSGCLVNEVLCPSDWGCWDQCDAQYPAAAALHIAKSTCAFCGQCNALCSNPNQPPLHDFYGCYERFCLAGQGGAGGSGGAAGGGAQGGTGGASGGAGGQ